MMQWIDTHAVPLLALLLLAAAGGFFVLQRGLLAPVATPSTPAAARYSTRRWLVLCLVAAVGLIGLAWSVHAGGTPGGALPAPVDNLPGLALDHRVQRWVQSQGDAAWLPLVRAFTQLGHPLWMVLLSVAVGAWLLRRRAWLLAGAWVLGTAGVGLWVRILKLGLGRDRPEVRWALEQGYSFPSGHSAGTLVCYGLLTWMALVLLRPAHPRRWMALAAAAVLGVGASRVLLGVHYVSDVLAGWLLGLAWLSGVVALTHVAWRQLRQRPAAVSGAQAQGEKH